MGRAEASSRRAGARPRRFVCECGGLYILETREIAGLPYELYACPTCGDTIFTRDQARAYREVHALAKVAQELGPQKLRHVGNSVNATVPKGLVDLGFREGRRYEWVIESPTRITLRLISNERAPRGSGSRAKRSAAARQRRQNATRSGRAASR